MDGTADAASVSRSVSPLDAEMRDQLHTLHEREMLLSQKLALEREKRMQAERVTETQRQACMELHLLLDKERRLSGRYSKAPQSKLLRKQKSHGTADKAANGVKESHLPAGQGEQGISHERLGVVGNGISIDSGSDDGEEGVEPLPSLAARGSLSDEVFNNLPEDLRELLRSASSSSKMVQPTGNQALFDAAICGDAASLEYCLKKVKLADSVKTQNNSTLTHIVAARGYLDCLQVLLEAGADPNSVGPALSTPVILAAAEGHHKCLRLLMAAGGYSTHRDAEGCDALYRATLGGHDNCVRVLLDGGMESFGANNMGQTAIHAAVQSQSTSCLRILLTRLRAHHSESTVARLLCAQDHNGQSVVHYAAGSGAKACLEILLPSPELDLELRDRWNRTALDVATADCRELLISRDFREVLLVVNLGNNRDSEEESEGDHIVVGRVHVLRHHKWSDLDLLVEDSLAGYCSMLKGHPRPQGGGVVRQGVGEGDQGNDDGKEDEAGRKIQQGRRHTSEVLDDFYSVVAGLSLSPHPIQSYRVGQVTWKWGEAPRGGQPRGPFMLFAPREGDPFDARPEVVVTLTGVAQGSVDDIALSTLYPSTMLSSYIELVHRHKNVIIHGPSGSGKTHLARHIAECLKASQDLIKPEVVHAVMHPGFKREDLLRLLHFTGALVPVLAERDGETPVVLGEEEGSSVPPSPSAVSPRPSVTSVSHSIIVILDDIDRISLPEVLGEIAGLLDKRGPQYAVWMGPAHGRGGDEETKCYYLREDVFFVATMNKKCGSDLDQFCHDRFKHVWLSPNKEPMAGLLLRHLMRKAIHANKGRLPARSSQFYLTLQWVCDVWCLLNHYLTRIGLVEAHIGPRHFFTCPVQGGSTEAITQWMVELWNTQLAPLIHDVSVYSHPAGGVERVDVCAQVLTTLTQRAFRPTSPMDPRATLKLLMQLDGGEEGLAMVADARRKAKGGKSPVMSYLDLKDDRSIPMQRATSAGSLPHHSVGSTPSHTPQGTPGVPRRETFAGNTTKGLNKSTTSSSVPEGEAAGKKTNSLPTHTPPLTKKEWKNTSSPEKDKKAKRKSIGRMFAKKKAEDEEGLRSTSPSHTVDEGEVQETVVNKKPIGLDEIVDLVYYLSADRLNEQRSPLPTLRNFPQPATNLPGQDPSPLAHATAGTPTVELQRSPKKASPQSLQNNSTDTSTSLLSVKGGGDTPVRSRDASPNVSGKNSSVAPPGSPKGEAEAKSAGSH